MCIIALEYHECQQRCKLSWSVMVMFCRYTLNWITLRLLNHPAPQYTQHAFWAHLSQGFSFLSFYWLKTCEGLEIFNNTSRWALAQTESTRILKTIYDLPYSTYTSCSTKSVMSFVPQDLGRQRSRDKNKSYVWAVHCRSPILEVSLHMCGNLQLQCTVWPHNDPDSLDEQLDTRHIEKLLLHNYYSHICFI